ncbi:hypothetical protein B0G81_8226 [Paraburkholderia sp. BL6665CI2N2]|nr:hypothetical protein B0G81_8226 [Paraburkholderia sp. BL6665CI2N2]
MQLPEFDSFIKERQDGVMHNIMRLSQNFSAGYE